MTLTMGISPLRDPINSRSRVPKEPPSEFRRPFFVYVRDDTEVLNGYKKNI